MLARRDTRGVDPGEGSPLVSITNLSESGQRIAIQCLAAHGKGISKTVDLLKGETLLTEACSQRTVHGAVIESLSEAESEAEGNESEGLRGPIGISLTTDGMPGTLAAFGLRRHKNNDKESSFSAVTFTDPKMLNSSTTIFAGVPVGPASLLQEGKYVPELSLANFSAKDLKIHAQYTQTSGAAPTTNEIAALTLPAGTSRSLKFDSLQGDSQLQNSFLVTSNGSPGDLMAKLVSRSDSSPASVELLGKDAQDSNNGGSNPWSIEDGAESTLLFFNHDQAPQIFNVLIASADGTQWDKDFKLAPMETRAISIRDIIQNAVKDDKGKMLPKTAVSGQISWWTVGTASGPGTGRLLQSNPASGMARSFACGCPYILCGVIFNQDVSSLPVGTTAAPLDDLTPLICMYKVNSHCSGLPGSYTSSQALSYYWYSSNTAVLQISGSSTDSYVNGYGAGVGTATMTGRVSATYYGPPMTCQFSGSAQTTVTPPHHLKVLSDTYQSLSSCPTTVRRLIKYQSVDVNNASVGTIQTKEQFGTKFANTCNNGAPGTSETCSSDTNGIFTDQLFIGCNTVGGSCGVTYTHQQWLWCPAGGTPVVIATPGDLIVHNDMVSVGGNTSGFPAGTYIYP